MSAEYNPVGWFEIPVADMNRAKKFYENVFGFELTLTEMEPVLMAWFPWKQGVDGAPGTLIRAEGYKPSHEGVIIYFSVDVIDSMLKKIITNGGKTLVPKMDIGEYGCFAHFEDSEGNRIALHSNQK